MYERFSDLMKQKGITAYQLSKATGISQTTFSDWKKGRSVPKTDKLQKIADHLQVTLDYLLTGEEVKEKTPTLTKKDERDIAKKLDEMLGELGATGESLMFDGEPLDDETRELLRASLKNQLEMTKRMAKQKYTPKKYRG